MADYFKAAKVMIANARKSVHFLNWAFDPSTFLHPQSGCTGPELDQIGPFLKQLAWTTLCRLAPAITKS